MDIAMEYLESAIQIQAESGRQTGCGVVPPYKIVFLAVADRAVTAVLYYRLKSRGIQGGHKVVGVSRMCLKHEFRGIVNSAECDREGIAEIFMVCTQCFLGILRYRASLARNPVGVA